MVGPMMDLLKLGMLKKNKSMIEEAIKAREIVIKMQFQKPPLDFEQAKQCAIICVDEILNEFPKGFKGNFEEVRKQYLEKVKTEIEKL